MDNQHRKIAGYRELSQVEVDLMNEIESLGPHIEELCTKISSHVEQQFLYAEHQDKHENDRQELDRLRRADPLHWLAWGRDGMQNNLMMLTRAVEQPTFF